MKKILVVAVFMVALLSDVSYAEERFVGEFMNAGYYAEVDNITVYGDYLITNVTVKKPFYNKFIKESVRYNQAEKTYEILKREIYQYNPRELMEKQKVSNVALPLDDGSPYKKILEFVLDWKKMTEYDI